MDSIPKTDVYFGASKEKRFLLDIIDDILDRQLDAFVDHVWNFDYAMELTSYELTMLKVRLIPN